MLFNKVTCGIFRNYYFQIKKIAVLLRMGWPGITANNRRLTLHDRRLLHFQPQRQQQQQLRPQQHLKIRKGCPIRLMHHKNRSRK